MSTSTPELMSTGEWYVLFTVLGLSFTSFIVVILIGWRSNKHLHKGEMRRAITAFLIVTFGLLVGASFFTEGPKVPDELKGLFAGAVTTVIGFYFGSRKSETEADRNSPDGSVDNTSSNGNAGGGDSSER